MADYGDGNWHAATLGQFVGQLVDHGDTAVIFRQMSVTPHEGNQESTRWEVILVADGHLRKNYLPRCQSVHKTLQAFLDANMVS
jgi:hypothetical protein